MAGVRRCSTRRWRDSFTRSATRAGRWLSPFRAGTRTLSCCGDRKAADAALADLVANGRDGLAYQIAQVYAVRGETDKAFEWLQIAFDNHDGGMLSLAVDPLLRGLRDDPRYKNLLVKLGLPATP